MTDDQQRWQEIWAYQSREIETLAADAAKALSAGKRAHYSRIAVWLGPAVAGRTLELGCGPGRYVALLASLGHEVTGVDPYPNDAWALIRKHHSVNFRDRVFAESLPFEDGAFDNAACLGALLYFKDVDAALGELRRVTKPGGRTIFRTVSDIHLFTRCSGKRLDESATNYFTRKSLAATLDRAGFSVHRQFSYGFFPPFGGAAWWWLINGKLPIQAQEMISALTPPPLRVNLVAFATRR